MDEVLRMLREDHEHLRTHGKEQEARVVEMVTIISNRLETLEAEVKSLKADNEATLETCESLIRSERGLFDAVKTLTARVDKTEAK